MKIAATCTLLSLLAGPLLALPEPQQQAQNAPEPGLEDLLDILQEETAVASKNRMNADFVPGMVTVLHGSDMEALGVETVWEALSVVPGLQAIRSPDGLPTVVVRGIDFPFNSGNIKILVNSVPLSRDNAGVNSTVLLLPIQQVDRIEFIRGPGSVVHGEFAFMGLVNVITRSRETRAFARYGGDGAFSAGATLAFTPGEWELALGAAGLANDEPPLDSTLSAEEGRASGSFSARRGGFSFLAEGMARDLDPVGTTNTANGSQEHWAVDTRYGRPWGAVRVDGHATWRDNDYVETTNSFEGDVRELGLDLSGKAGRHEWVTGALYQRSSIETATFRRPPVAGRPPSTITVTDQPRTVWSLMAEDRVDLTGSVALVGGLRFDDDSNVGSRVTPRVALVYRVTDHHILKAQYAEGFRPPTFFELYGATGTAATGIDYEVNGTAEVTYVYRHPHAVVRATAFHTKLRDMIFLASLAPTFGNVAEARTQGVELEWEQQVGSRLRLLANVAFIDEEENRNLRRETFTTPTHAGFLGNVAVLFRPLSRLLLTTRLNHVGERSDAQETAGWDVLDVSATVQDVGVRGLSLRAGVKNAFDDEVVYVLANALGASRHTFPGRTAWIQLTWDRP